jgi:hypothetical protein
MPQPRIARPDENEYAPSFHGYIFRVPDGNLIELLDEQVAATRAMLGSLSDSDARFRYGSSVT